MAYFVAYFLCQICLFRAKYGRTLANYGIKKTAYLRSFFSLFRKIAVYQNRGAYGIRTHYVQRSIPHKYCIFRSIFNSWHTSWHTFHCKRSAENAALAASANSFFFCSSAWIYLRMVSSDSHPPRSLTYTDGIFMPSRNDAA